VTRKVPGKDRKPSQQVWVKGRVDGEGYEIKNRFHCCPSAKLHRPGLAVNPLLKSSPQGKKEAGPHI